MKSRRSTHLPDYDTTSAGAYCVTLVIYGCKCLFGEVVAGEMRLNEWRFLAKNEWQRLDQRFERVGIDEYIIMPNHIHGIINIVGAGQENIVLSRESSLAPPLHAPPLRKNTSPGLAPGSLGAFIGAFKSTTARLINGLRHTPGAPVWQRNYYEHIIRDEVELRKIQKHIISNLLEWDLDRENPASSPMEFYSMVS